MSFFKKKNNPVANFFKKTPSKSNNNFFSKNSDNGLGLNLQNVIKGSYKPTNNLNGFVKDEELSGKRNQVYVNPENNKLLMTVAGTRSAYDVLNDLRLATGGIKNTKRYKSADETLKNAKQKYNTNATVIGHSLGGAIASRIGGSDDNIITYNAGEVGGKNRPNVSAIRHSGDLISVFGAGKSQSFGNPLSTNLLNNHKSDKLGDNYFI